MVVCCVREFKLLGVLFCVLSPSVRWCVFARALRAFDKADAKKGVLEDATKLENLGSAREISASREGDIF